MGTPSVEYVITLWNAGALVPDNVVQITTAAVRTDETGHAQFSFASRADGVFWVSLSDSVTTGPLLRVPLSPTFTPRRRRAS